MKRKKDQENRVSEVCEPRVAYNSAVPCAETAAIADSNSVTAMPDDCMSVEEYFNKLKTMVNEYYENISCSD